MQGHTLQRIIGGLVRRTWLVALMTVVVCAVFTAHAVAALVEARYLEPSLRGVPPPPPQRAPVAPTQRAKPDGAGLLARNMFCSECTTPLGSGPTDPSYSGAPAVLIATSIGIDPLATVRVIGSDVQGCWGVGDLIPGVGTIVHIGFLSIEVIDANNHHGRLSLLDAAPGSAVAVAAANATAAPEWADKIKKIDDFTYDVDRNLIRELVTGSAKPGGARASPVIDDGVVKGVRFGAVKDSSLAAALGIKNGDQIATIDGEPIKSVQQMLDLYAKLDQVNAFELAGTRAGKPLALKFQLR
jgi:hypothetical protein